MALLDKLGDIAKNVADKTQTLADVSKLQSQITEENNRITALKLNISNYYYGRYEKGDMLDDEIMNDCRLIAESLDSAQNLQDEIARLKAGSAAPAAAGGSPYTSEQSGIACPGCGAVQPVGSKFCPICGAKMEA